MSVTKLNVDPPPLVMKLTLRYNSSWRLYSVYNKRGLVVHAAADGVALGAATLTDKADVEFIIFLAIMLHKAPAAFGLTSFLLHEGQSHGSHSDVTRL
eukprot:sb/3478932/